MSGRDAPTNTARGHGYKSRSTYPLTAAMTDNKPAALAALKKALDVNSKDAEVRFRAALIYNHFGDTELTLKWIAKALEAGYPPQSIRDTPDFEGLKGVQGFLTLVGSARK